MKKFFLILILTLIFTVILPTGADAFVSMAAAAIVSFITDVIVTWGIIGGMTAVTVATFTAWGLTAAGYYYISKALTPDSPDLSMAGSSTYAGSVPVLTISPGGAVPEANGLCFLSGNVVRQNNAEEASYIKLLVDFGKGEWDEILGTYINGIEWSNYVSAHTKYEHLGSSNQSGVTNLFTDDACSFRNHVVVEYQFVKGDEVRSLQNICVVARTRKCLNIGQDIGGTESFTRNPAQILWDFYLKKKEVNLIELDQNSFSSLKTYCETSLCYIDKTYYPVNVPIPSTNTVKATSYEWRWGYQPWHVINLDHPLTGDAAWYSWASMGGYPAEQRINFDFGRKVVITRIKLSNYHLAGTETDRGIKSFVIQGSNTATDMADTDYDETGTDWTNVKTGITATQHSTSDVIEWQTVDVDNITGYRYYSLKIADNYGDLSWMAFRQIRFFTGNASAECTGDETNIRCAFDYNNDTKISINDFEKIIWQSFNGMIIRSQGKYKPVWDGAQEADGAGSLQAKAVQHNFVVANNVVEQTLNWNKLEHPNVYIINCLDSANAFKKCSDAIYKNDQDIGVKGEVPNEETCWWLIDYALAARRCKWKYNKGQYPDYIVGLTGHPDSQAVELYDRTTVTDTQAGFASKDFIVVQKDEDQFGRSQFLLESWLSGIYDPVGFQQQIGYSIKPINPLQPLLNPVADDVTVSMVSGALRVQFTPSNSSSYINSKIWVSTDDVAYTWVASDSDGDVLINGCGTFWNAGDTVYVKITQVSTGSESALPADEVGSVTATAVTLDPGNFQGAIGAGQSVKLSTGLLAVSGSGWVEVESETGTTDNLDDKISGVTKYEEVWLYSKSGNTITIVPSACLKMPGKFTLAGPRIAKFICMNGGTSVCWATALLDNRA